MTDKHTPGDWGRNIKPAAKYPIIYAGRNTHVVQILSQGLTPDEVEANCNLVAAAPAMLAALREAETHLTAISHPNCGATPGDPLHTIRAAIARATGV